MGTIRNRCRQGHGLDPLFGTDACPAEKEKQVVNTADVSKELDELRADIAGIREDISSLIGSIRDLAAERVRMAGARINEVGRRARVRANLARDNIEHQIEERPIASVVTCFGLGFVLGRLLDRRR
jgi:ElaB/YqjD/DUF883 family membrane-anchored ribosome-binding protein